jgi:hypothetical protein
MDTGTPLPTRPRAHRARWAAIGAAIAVSLGAGGLGIVHATAPDGASAYIPIEPCRLVDTRSDAQFHVGPHSTLGPDSSITIDGYGAQGECTSPALPNGTEGLQLNVTALGATTPTHLTIYPGAGDPPNASSLNPFPGQPPAPNAVATPLSGAGQFSVYNFQGSIDVIIDVVGYYGDHHHDDRYGPALPDAVATINANATVRSGYGIDDIVWNAVAGRYEVTFDGFEYNDDHDVAVVSGMTPGHIVTQLSNDSGTMWVTIKDDGGTTRQEHFTISVWDLGPVLAM